jgi:hypothetical protein
VFVCSVWLSQFIAIILLKSVNRFAFAVEESPVRKVLNLKVLVTWNSLLSNPVSRCQ